VQRASSRLIKVQSVGLAAFGAVNPNTATASQAIDVFGEPASIAPGAGGCRGRWPDLGLTIDFGAGDDSDPCGGGARPTELQVAGPVGAAAGWRTAEGIRPLQPLASVRRIYPEAGRVRSGRLVLVRPPSGEAPGVPVLVVRVARGRVDALVFPIIAPES
jgi:hypothetical protein